MASEAKPEGRRGREMIPPPIPPPPSIVLHELSKWYGDVIGVNQVTLDIRPGVTGLLGPNGAGKSTLMKLLTGQLRADKGSVQILGTDPWSNPDLFRRAGYCPDAESLYEDMSALEFVTLVGRLADFGAAESRRRAAAQLERVSLSAHMNRVIKGYSKGMRQRTKLAAALLHDPELIILDEPLNGLDPMGRIEMLNLLKSLGTEGKTVVVSSHILHEIESLTSKIVLIHHGRILAEGQIGEIRALIENQPLTLRIASPTSRAVAVSLAALHSLVSMEFTDGIITARCNRPEEVYEALQSGTIEGRFSITELTALDDNLAAVFQYLVKE